MDPVTQRMANLSDLELSCLFAAQVIRLRNTERQLLEITDDLVHIRNRMDDITVMMDAADNERRLRARNRERSEEKKEEAKESETNDNATV